jgi:glycerol-3-phosphate acyltransferase PlsX
MASRFSRLRQQVRDRRLLRRHGPVTVALDVMGSEVGVDEMLLGAMEAISQLPLVSVMCVGDEAHIRAGMRRLGISHERLKVQHASDVIGMDEQPHQAVKKADSSVAVAAKLVHEKVADALVSPGNTGATMAVCMVTWRRLKGISRPAIATILPHPKRPCMLLDVGANVDCKPRNLLHFGLMGSTYARLVLHRRRPRVGVLSNGEEDCKGTELVKEAAGLLRGTNLNFGGNAEGRDLMSGTFDVVVCDGFVGNVVLKFGEALAEFIMTNLKEEVRRSVISQAGALAMLPALQRFRKQVDHAEYGGAPLLGLNGVCIICHGSSRAKAIRNAIRVASEQVSLKVNDHILAALEENPDAPPKAADCVIR